MRRIGRTPSVGPGGIRSRDKLRLTCDLIYRRPRGASTVYDGPRMRTLFLLVGMTAVGVASAPHLGAQDPGGSRQTAIVTAAARLAPAVVSVNVLRRERRLAQDPFDLFFMPRGAGQAVEGYGSGFIISSDGVVITNQHVTQGSEQTVVTMRDGRDRGADRLGGDQRTGLDTRKLDR